MRRGPGLDVNNCHLLVLDGHNLHVTLEVCKISMESGLDIISLPSHTSHALHPIDVSCFAPLKKVFKKIKDVWLLRKKDAPVDKKKCFVNGPLEH